MIKIGNYYIGEARLKQVVKEGKPLAVAYPKLPSDIIAKLQEESDRLFSMKPTKKKTKKKVKP